MALLQKALASLKAAKEAYVKGTHSGHPKVRTGHPKCTHRSHHTPRGHAQWPPEGHPNPNHNPNHNPNTHTNFDR